MAALPRFRRAVYAVVRYVDPHPDDAHRIIWTRCDFHFGICGIGVPKQARVVVVGWISHYVSDHPVPEREWVVLATTRHRGVKDDLASPVIYHQDRCLLRDNDLDGPGLGPRRLFSAQYVGDTDMLSRNKPGAGVQALEQGRCRVESPVELFQHGRVIEARQLRLLRRTFRNRLEKRTGGVFLSDRIGHDRFNSTGAKRLEQLLAAPRTWSNPARGLERRQGLAAVLADLSVDLTRREAGSIEKDLHFELCGRAGPS